jgi:hypothetical protein
MFQDQSFSATEVRDPCSKMGHGYQQKVQSENARGHAESSEIGGILHSGSINIETPRGDNPQLSGRQIASASLIEIPRRNYSTQSTDRKNDAASVWGRFRKPFLDGESDSWISACNLNEMEYAVEQAAIHLARERIASMHKLQPPEVEEIQAQLLAFLHTHVIFPKYLTSEPATKSWMGHLAGVGLGCHCQLRHKAWLTRNTGKAYIHGRGKFRRNQRLPKAWTQSRIQQLCRALLQQLCTWPSFEGHQKLEGTTEQGLALFFDCALRCGGQLIPQEILEK